MDFNYVESLVTEAKNNNISAYKKITKEFTPLIINLSNKTYVPGYEKNDIINECYIYLLQAIKKYDTSKHRFVAYATSAIKQNLYFLIKKSKTITCSSIDEINPLAISSNESLDKNLLCNEEKHVLSEAVKKLSKEEYNLYKHIFVYENSLKEYAYINNLSYSTAYRKKKKLLLKLCEALRLGI